MPREKRISQEALSVLTECVQDGQVVRIAGGQLDRKLYEEVDSILRAIGGKWNRGRKGHVFQEPVNEVADMLEGCIATGRVIPLRPNGYFRTPPAVARELILAADIREGMSVLEPSAGDGAIVSELLDFFGWNGEGLLGKRHLTCNELDQKLHLLLLEKFTCFRALQAGGIDILNRDFLALDTKYDRIIMNPPFIRLSEIDHILHAQECLKEGGRVVSVASASITFHRAKKAVDFRAHVEQCGYIKPFPPGSFKESGTMVNCVMCVLNAREK